jgi:hypothetical protein
LQLGRRETTSILLRLVGIGLRCSLKAFFVPMAHESAWGGSNCLSKLQINYHLCLVSLQPDAFDSSKAPNRAGELPRRRYFGAEFPFSALITPIVPKKNRPGNLGEVVKEHLFFWGSVSKRLKESPACSLAN